MKISILQLGKISAFLAFLFTTLFVIVQLLQLLRLVNYPYDELFIYGTSFCNRRRQRRNWAELRAKKGVCKCTRLL